MLQLVNLHCDVKNILCKLFDKCVLCKNKYVISEVPFIGILSNKSVILNAKFMVDTFSLADCKKSCTFAK